MPVLSDVESNCVIAVSQNTKCKGMCSLRRRDRSLEPDMSTYMFCGCNITYRLSAKAPRVTVSHAERCLPRLRKFPWTQSVFSSLDEVMKDYQCRAHHGRSQRCP
jgi:hypothetical protein